MDVTHKELIMNFEDGDEVVAGVMQALQEHKVKLAIFSSISGRIKDFEVTFLQAGILQKKHFADEYKCLNVSGDVKLLSGKGYVPNIILALSNLDGSKALGGQLHSGHACADLMIKATIREYRQ